MLWETVSKSWQAWDKSCMSDTLNREPISPNSVTQGKDSESFQGRGLCHRWQRPETDGMKKDLEEDHNQEWNWPGDTVTSGLCIEEEGWYRKYLNMKLSPANCAEDTGAEAVAQTPWEQATSFCVLTFLETQWRKWRKINPSEDSLLNSRWW